MTAPDPTSVRTEGEEPAEATTFSAGEAGAADGTDSGTAVEVVVGEIPAAEEPTTMLWTARCSHPDHDLLGRFDTREDAEKARSEHLDGAHGGVTT